jgi:hypothetical protein
MFVGKIAKVVKCVKRPLRLEILVLKRGVSYDKLEFVKVHGACNSTVLLATLPYKSSTTNQRELLKSTGKPSDTRDRNSLGRV